MSRRFLTVLALLLLLITLVVSPILGTVGVVRAEEPPVNPQSDTSDPNQVAGPVVWLRALDSFVRPGGQTSFELIVKNVADLYGLSLDLKYDPSLLTLDPASATQAVATSGLYTWDMNTYDSTTGKVTLTDLLTGPVQGLDFVDGKWHQLAQLTFNVAASATNQSLGFSLVPASAGELATGTATVKLSDSFGQPISFTGFGGGLNIDGDAAIVSGRITAAGSDPVVGLPNVWVELMPMAPGTDSIGSVTDEQGCYAITVAPGEYKLAARTDPWATVPYVSQYFSSAENQYSWPEATVFTLATTENKTIDLSLELGQAISGKVTDAEAGTPLEQIWVHAVNASNMFICDTCSGSTNQLGEYRLVVPAGSFYIRAQGGSMFWDDWHRVGTDEKTAIATVAGDLPLLNKDIGLSEKATVAVSGTVVDAVTKLPLSNVWVDIRSFVEPAAVVESVQTDAGGNYQVSVPAGNYRVLTQDYLSNGIPYAQMFYDANTGSFSWDGAEPLVVGNEPVTGIDFALQPSGWIEGDVKGADGNALPQAIVAAIKPGNPPLRFGSAETNSTGHFKLVVPPGEYAVAAHYPPNHEGYPEVWYPNVIHPELSGRVSVIDAGSTVSDISLKLKPYAGSISGQVLDAENHPIGGLPVGAYLAGQQAQAYAMTWTGPNGDYSLSLPAGTYLIGTMAREWQQPFIDEWYDNQADPTTATSLAVSDTASHEGINLTLSRLPHANLAPSCFFDDNLPASTKIELDPGKLGLTADQTIYYTIRSWIDGSKQNGEISFDFESETNIYDLPLPNNPVLPSNGAAGYDVTIYSTVDRTGTPLASCNPIVIFPSSSARTLNGTITEAGTEPPVPIVGARVVAEGFGEGHIRFEAFTGELGTYSLRLPGGILYGYRVSVDKKDVFPMLWHGDEGLVGDWGEADPVMVTSTSPEGTILNLAVPAQMPTPGIGIWPRCLFDDQSSTNINVWITPASSGLTTSATIGYELFDKLSQATTGISGTFDYVPTESSYEIGLPQLNAGKYVIRFSANDKLLDDPTLMVYAADEAGTLSGKVTNSVGQALARAQVLAECYTDDKTVFDTHTDDSGNYLLRLPAGDYRLAVQPVAEGPLVWYDNTTHDGATMVTVVAGENEVVNTSLLSVGPLVDNAALGFSVWRANRVEVPQVGVFFSKSGQAPLSAGDAVFPNSYLIVDVTGQGLLGATTASLEMGFRGDLLEVVLDDNQKPFRLGGADYLDLLDQLMLTNKVDEDRVLVEGGNSAANASDAGPLGYMVFRVKDVPGDLVTFSWLHSEVGWSAQQSYQIAAHSLSLTLVQGIQRTVTAGIPFQTGLTGLEIRVYSVTDTEFADPLAVAQPDAGGVVVLQGLDPAVEYNFVAFAPRCLSRLVHGSLNALLSLDFGAMTKGDLDGNDTVNFTDFQIFVDAYKKDAGGDLDGDGATNFTDFQIFVEGYKRNGSTRSQD